MIQQYRFDVTTQSGYVLIPAQPVPFFGMLYIDVCNASFSINSTPISREKGIDTLRHRLHSKPFGITVTGALVLTNTSHDFLETGEVHWDEALARRREMPGRRWQNDVPSLFNDVAHKRHAVEPHWVCVAAHVELLG